MTFNDSILLPSQETLVQRLQHVSLYGQQLIAVTGGNGSGKTTLITSLLNELEEFSSALVTCPKHCESSEIRRKILVQLFSDPVFDDEIPLADTILRLSSSLPQSSFIVLDDAHYLPMELIAECIMLSLLDIPGKNLSLTLTCSQSFFDELEAGLSDTHQETLLCINIEPLAAKEREALYYTLLSRSAEDPFTPREIVKSQLEKQLGNPQEVVNLLELSLNGQTSIEPPRRWPKGLLAGLLLLVVCITSLLLFIMPSSQAISPSIDKTVTQAWGKPTTLVTYGEQVLVGYFENRAYLLDKQRAEILLASQEKKHTESLLSAESSTEVISKPDTALAENKPEVFTAKPVEIIELQTNKQPTPVEVKQDKPVITDGYTLQIASVRKAKSLKNILSALKPESEVSIARHGDRWIVLLGEFSSLGLANEKARSLVEKYQIGLPWVRQLKDIVDYERQDSLAINDIPI
ncbi:AAA family ATPase [Shewanella sp. UCD-KL12]|uniref:AAA family ATPase n=1 Tax=Shewanella sp. UCD-KL12 TaxID=1917163 RepID=UPI000970A7D3|nr:AAA family ATPase [Shewanella sp. UCD-KL12]